MGSRRFAPILTGLVVLLLGSVAQAASYRTTNFIVQAQDPQVAKQVGDYAEKYRREKAMMWLGQEMPNWPQPCPLYVTITMDGPSGATSFQFGQGRVLSIKMEIQGPLDRLLASVLPHEVTHTVFAMHFRQPVPRWADEGGSVLSEDDLERERHDRLTRQILNRNQQIPLRRLFSLKEYPREVMCLYAQGYSMSDYLVKRSSHGMFLNFVGHGMQYGWDSAVQSFYGHKNVEELEQTWLQHLRDTRDDPRRLPAQVASAKQPRPAAAQQPQTQAASRPIVRLTVPPTQPLDPSPIVRGAAPTPDQLGQRFATANPEPTFTTPSISVPPLVPPQAGPQPMGNWVPAYPANGPVAHAPAGPVGVPQTPVGQFPTTTPSTPQIPATQGPLVPAGGPFPGQPQPSYGAPVGFPRQ